MLCLCCMMMPHFYPRPPRGGRHVEGFVYRLHVGISIHALREEGDPAPAIWQPLPRYFYPRPPRGGRHRQAGVFIFLF